MSEKLTTALTNLEKAREAALQAALTERAYRTLSLFDPEGPVQRAIVRARRLTSGEAPTKPAKK